jgi:hypothetical protein
MHTRANKRGRVRRQQGQIGMLHNCAPDAATLKHSCGCPAVEGCTAACTRCHSETRAGIAPASTEQTGCVAHVLGDIVTDPEGHQTHTLVDVGLPGVLKTWVMPIAGQTVSAAAQPCAVSDDATALQTAAAMSSTSACTHHCNGRISRCSAIKAGASVCLLTSPWYRWWRRSREPGFRIHLCGWSRRGDQTMPVGDGTRSGRAMSWQAVLDGFIQAFCA